MNSNEKKNDCHAVLELSYGDERKAASILGAVDLENRGYVDAELSGGTIIFRCRSFDPGILRNTLDDLLSCVGIAERIVGCCENGKSDEK